MEYEAALKKIAGFLPNWFILITTKLAVNAQETEKKNGLTHPTAKTSRRAWGKNVSIR